ncbi:hypothetical protein [Deminuibacter soli]|uniref:TonB-dependent receptor plug domain-containing protein n=1 Tax=Deminuibacter soli TaxID=2291815 RepID=A0A3E1NGQ3_9BACT|nr:hypothetical protein [Deminuibacter soli]RFM27067.1 hypothetical protein DXN05_16500 [Deminuibacter soli]
MKYFLLLFVLFTCVCAQAQKKSKGFTRIDTIVVAPPKFTTRDSRATQQPENNANTVYFNRPPDTTNHPLYVVDGTEFNTPAFPTIDPMTITGIDQVKDSAALKKYGERGKNGVYLITTRGGIYRTKTRPARQTGNTAKDSATH